MSRTLTTTVYQGRSTDGYGMVRQGRLGRDLVNLGDVVAYRVWNPTTGAVLIDKDSTDDPGGIAIADDGSYHIPLNDADTGQIPGTYRHEVVLTLLSGKQYTIIDGTFIVLDSPS